MRENMLEDSRKQATGSLIGFLSSQKGLDQKTQQEVKVDIRRERAKDEFLCQATGMLVTEADGVVGQERGWALPEIGVVGLESTVSTNGSRHGNFQMRFESVHSQVQRRRRFEGSAALRLKVVAHKYLKRSVVYGRMTLSGTSDGAPSGLRKATPKIWHAARLTSAALIKNRFTLFNSRTEWHPDNPVYYNSPANPTTLADRGRVPLRITECLRDASTAFENYPATLIVDRSRKSSSTRIAARHDRPQDLSRQSLDENISFGGGTVGMIQGNMQAL
ncbi:hypothetical protein SISNIDRAFT_467592 [Sistotremastrum niveocremeum HHB9708]|uniref:Uncharacterized protein n=1 Tax=Sistotremastrum niveocremeum HHB9708 TaxID=1314777 RepID=A0A164SNP7_9AGAM|nr:hypothetical protein SISNIDRAFT_467592 [Sistotremastrum niveocremeum HHB9708]